MAGANPMWVAKQLGHATMAMLLTTYSRWIDGADKSAERAKIDTAFDPIATAAPHKTKTL
ncbi:integrase family protein, partial [mine drainage metagenome]